MRGTFAAAALALMCTPGAARAQAVGSTIELPPVSWSRVVTGTFQNRPYHYLAGGRTLRADGITEFYELDVFAEVGVLIRVEVDCHTLDFRWVTLTIFGKDLRVEDVIPDASQAVDDEPREIENQRMLMSVCSGDPLPIEPNPLGPLELEH